MDKQERRKKYLLFIATDQAESKMFDDVFGNKVKEDGLITVIETIRLEVEE